MDKGIGNTSGVLIDIKRFAVHDGPGIRTTFFLKGCTLRCRWCHNPEGIAPQPELAFYAHKCRNCGYCVETCPHGAHTLHDGVHQFDRSKCRVCGECEKWCSASALKLYGRKITVDEALAVALEDRAFYDGSHGGVTLSGGEPLAQLEFTTAFLAKLKSSGVHTALDTCLAVPRSRVEAVLQLADMFLCDLAELHSRLIRNVLRFFLPGLVSPELHVTAPRIQSEDGSGIAAAYADLLTHRKPFFAAIGFQYHLRFTSSLR